MKRWLVAVAVLLGGAAPFSLAVDNYVLIRAVLGGRRSQDPNQPGQPGVPGGVPGVPGIPGIPGGPGAPPRGEQPGGPGDGGLPTLGSGGDIDTAALAVQAVVRVYRKPGSPFASYVITPWTAHDSKAHTRLFNDAQTQTLIALNLPMVTVNTRFHAKRIGLEKNRTPERVLETAEWALTHGLVDQFADFMDELVKNKEDQSSAAPANLKCAVKAYAATKAALDKPIEREDRATFWRNRLSARSETSKHYAVVYTSPVSNPPEVQSRLAMLEHHMKAFYYWFALKGHALPMPDDKLVAVLLDQPGEFTRQRATGEDEPLVDDGFYAHRDHICVFSTQRLDAAYQAFTRQTQPVWASGQYERTALLDGTARRKVSTTTPSEFARYETLALLEKALETEGERAAVTHEGTRQLLVAAGLIPRAVEPPHWTEFGTAAIFETPKGPFPGAPVASRVAIFPGVVAPSWAYLRPFKELIRQSEGEGLRHVPPADLLKQVVTDGYFNQVISPSDQRGLLKARCSAWALTYYLAKMRLPGLMRFYQELGSQPRDLELDGKSVLAAFARSFDIANATQDGIDPAKFEEFAKNWVAYMKGVSTPGAEFGLEAKEEPGPGGNTPGGTPGGPPSGAPGGRPGGGRPGGPGGRPGGPGGPGGRG